MRKIITQEKLIEALEILAPVMPVLFYWHDINGIVLGANELCLNSIGADKSIIGKSPYDFYPKEIADHILKHHKKVMDTKQVLSQEEMIEDITTGQTKYFMSIKAPLYNEDGIVIGIVGTSIETTAQKEVEKLKDEVHKLQLIENNYNYEKKVMQDFRNLVSELQCSIKSFEIQALNNMIGKERNYKKIKITLTKRQRDVLNLIALGKTPKEISAILSLLEKKNISPSTISVVINKQLYPKFGVNNISSLIEKMNFMKITPFMSL